MTASRDLFELAGRYVAFSNRHDLAAIAPLFAEDASYRSSAVGSYAGRHAILEMMTGFFASFPDVTWEVADYRLQGADSVVFDFTLRATPAEGGPGIVRQGIETIRFSAQGLIAEIQVRTPLAVGSGQE